MYGCKKDGSIHLPIHQAHQHYRQNQDKLTDLLTT